MMAATAARVKEGEREVSNRARLVRRAIWLLLAVGACLPAPPAAARPAGTAWQGGTTRDPQTGNKNKASSKPPTRTTAPTGTRRPTPRPTPDDLNTIENVRLKIVISGSVQPQGINVTLWSRERNMPVTRKSLKDMARQDGAYVTVLKKGLNRNKEYWVTVNSADGLLSGEAAVSPPIDDEEEVSVDITLYRAVTFDISSRREGDGPRREGPLSVVEKGQEPSSSVPYELGPDGKVSFDKGLKRGAEYVLLTGDGEQFPVNPDDIRNGVIRIDLPAPGPASGTFGTFIKVSNEEGDPLWDAKVTIILDDDDSQIHSKVTNEDGVAAFKADVRKVRAVAVETRGREIYSCGRIDEDYCPKPEGAGTINITLGDASWAGWVGSLLKSATGIVFVIVAAAIIVAGVAIFLRLVYPTPPLAPAHWPPADKWRAPTAPKTTSETAVPAGVNTSPRADGPGAQESGTTPAQDETAITYNSDAAAQPGQSAAAQPYLVPNPLSPEMAKEAYRRWMGKEKLTRNPLRLDLVLGNDSNDHLRLLKETNDPGSKFILFTDGESGGWLFPNPARGVFQTEVEQTWRLVFSGLSKEEFGRKTGQLNPVEARRADGAEGRGMWVAEQKPYEFS